VIEQFRRLVRDGRDFRFEAFDRGRDLVDLLGLEQILVHQPQNCDVLQV